MNYEDMFVTLIAFMFIFNLFINFFALAMPVTAAEILPASFTYLDYSLGDVEVIDINSMGGGASASSSESDTGFVLGLGDFGTFLEIFFKFFNNIFLGYYHLGMNIANGIAPTENSSGAIHLMLGGFGLLITIMLIFGMLLMLRSILFRV